MLGPENIVAQLHRLAIFLGVLALFLVILDRIIDAIMFGHKRRDLLPPTLEEVQTLLRTAEEERLVVLALLSQPRAFQRPDLMARLVAARAALTDLSLARHHRLVCLGDPFHVAAQRGILGPIRADGREANWVIPGTRVVRLLGEVLIVALLGASYLARSRAQFSRAEARRRSALSRGQMGLAVVIRFRPMVRLLAGACAVAYGLLSAVIATLWW